MIRVEDPRDSAEGRNLGALPIKKPYRRTDKAISRKLATTYPDDESMIRVEDPRDSAEGGNLGALPIKKPYRRTDKALIKTGNDLSR